MDFPSNSEKYTSFQISEIFCQMDEFKFFQTFCQILESREHEAKIYVDFRCKRPNEVIISMIFVGVGEWEKGLIC